MQFKIPSDAFLVSALGYNPLEPSSVFILGRDSMASRRLSTGLLAALVLSAAAPALAQLSPAEPDPLARIRDAAKSNVEACSATGETLCEQVAPKIIANALGESPLAENLRRLMDALKRQTKGTDQEAPGVTWAMAAFRDAGVEVHSEKYLVAPKRTNDVVAEIVVAEIRGREKPDEWVLLGADLDPSDSGSSGVDEACNAALVVEAARDIQLTGVRPRRSIRFVLFGGESQGMTGPWAYLKGHGNELDHVPPRFSSRRLQIL
jgi:Peptidase family M28